MKRIMKVGSFKTSIVFLVNLRYKRKFNLKKKKKREWKGFNRFEFVRNKNTFLKVWVSYKILVKIESLKSYIVFLFNKGLIA